MANNSFQTTEESSCAKMELKQSTVSTDAKNDTFQSDENGQIIFKQVLTFYRENELFDTILMAGDKNNTDRISIPAHRLVLSALSEYFREAYQDAQTVVNKNVLEFNEIEPYTLKSIIDFIYSGSIELNLNIVEQILRTAIFLKIKILIDGCCEFIERNLNASNSLFWFRLSTELGLCNIRRKSIEFIYIEFEQISNEEEFLMLTEDEIKHFLSNENPYTDFEDKVFISIIQWINYDKPNREHLIVELLKMIRYQHLSSKFITENMSICKTVESFELISSWLNYHLSPETRSVDQNILKTIFRPRHKTLLFVEFNGSNEICIHFYNPKENSWNTNAHRIQYHTGVAAFSTLVMDNKLFIVGGVDDFDHSFSKNEIECFDLSNYTSIDCDSMHVKRKLCQLADLNGQLFIFGGEHGYVFQYSVEYYNLTTNKTSLFELPRGHEIEKTKLAVCNGILYAIDISNSKLYLYTDLNQRWISRQIPYLQDENVGFTVLKGRLYIIGGTFTNKVKCWDMEGDNWRDLASTKYVYSHIKMIVFNEKIILSGKTLDNRVVAEEYDPDTNTWKCLNLNLGNGGSFCSSVLGYYTPRNN